MSHIPKNSQAESAGRSPLFEATNSARYVRQKQIRDYQDKFDCRLIVFIGPIHSAVITPFEETLYEADSTQDLHLMLCTHGGDPDTALRLIRQAQSRCKKLTVIVPDQAKSAGTLVTLGAHHILMGPTSDLGPIDPQLRVGDSWVAARTIIDAVKDVEERIQESPATFPVYASMLGHVTVLLLSQARSAVAQTDDLLRKAVACVPDRGADAIDQLVARLKGPLIKDHQSHNATISAIDAKECGLPVKLMPPSGDQWKQIWLLWTRYVSMSPNSIYRAQIYEGGKASFTDLP